MDPPEGIFHQEQNPALIKLHIEGDHMPYLASRHSPEVEQPSEAVTNYRGLVLSIAAVLFAVGVLSVCVLSVTAT